MDRINGFINLDNVLALPKTDISDNKEFLKFLRQNNPTVIVKKVVSNSQFIFSFKDSGETYYFKYDVRSKPYNELVFYYIAQDLGISSLFYDIAKVGNYEGVISRNFKKEDSKYILGAEILKKHYNIESIQQYKEHNNLEDIWFALEEHYKNRSDMQEVVAKVMDKLVHIFIFDILVGQLDRHPNNWGIVESANGEVDLQINFDNSRALIANHPLNIIPQFFVDETISYIDDIIASFQSISSSEFSHLLKDSLWVIGEPNIRKILGLVEIQIGEEIPPSVKEEYLQKFSDYYEFYQYFLEELDETRKGGK